MSSVVRGEILRLVLPNKNKSRVADNLSKRELCHMMELASESLNLPSRNQSMLETNLSSLNSVGISKLSKNNKHRNRLKLRQIMVVQLLKLELLPKVLRILTPSKPYKSKNPPKRKKTAKLMKPRSLSSLAV